MYKLTSDENVIYRIDTMTTIPKGHRFWDEYEKWLEEGNTPEPIETEEEYKNRIGCEAMHKISYLRNITDTNILPLQDAVDLEMATEEEIKELKILKKYRAELHRIKKQKGYPEKIIWPKKPDILE